MALTAFNSLAESAAAEFVDGNYNYTPTSSYITDQAPLAGENPTGYDENATEGGPPGWIRPHETRSYYTQTEPVLSEISAERTILDTNLTAYSFKSGFGIYTFQKSDPSLLVVKDLRGKRLVEASFGIESSIGAMLSVGEVVDASSSRIVTLQSVTCEGLSVGNFSVTTEFFDDKAPKITALIDFSVQMDETSFSIFWNLTIPETLIEIGDHEISSSMLPTTDSVFGTLTHFKTGSIDKAGSWSTDCTVDWSDAKCGNLVLQKVEKGVAARVVFPSGMFLIDPTIVSNSTSGKATSGSPFRNMVYYDGVYWLFYYTGTGIFYRTSKDGGVTWNDNPIQIPGAYSMNDMYPCFDVAIQSNHIAVCWVEAPKGPPPQSAVYFIDGYVQSDGIDWNNRIPVRSLDYEWGEWIGGVALSPNGTAFVTCWNYDPHVQTAEVITLMKWKTQSSFQELGNRFPIFNLDPYESNLLPRFVALPDGNLVLIVFVHPLNGTYWFFWHLYFTFSGTWNNAPLSDQLRGVCSMWNCMDFSACADSNGYVVSAYRSSTGALINMRLSLKSVGLPATSILLPSGTLDSAPSVSSGPANDLYIQYANSGGIREIHSLDGGNSWSGSRIMASSNSTSALTSGERLVSRNFISYTDTSTTPKRIMFASLPLPADVTGPYGDPWSAAGVNQDQPFSVGITDLISPGNGLLYLFQTDFVVPGRGSDMIASRFFATPQYFVNDSSGVYAPYLYDRFPFCNLGEGWQLNLPWVDSSYVHLWGGTKIAIEWNQWNGRVFNNSKGPQFVLTKVVEGTSFRYVLDLQDGMRVNFSGGGNPTGIFPNRLLRSAPDIELVYGTNAQLTYMKDYLNRKVYFNYTGDRLQQIAYFGKNVTFAYSGSRLTSTTDVLGRSTSFTYYDAGNPSLLIKSITYATGGTCNYGYGTIQVGTEAIAKVITDKWDDDHETIYSYTAVDGIVTYAQLDDYSLVSLYRWKGATEYNFDSRAKNTVVTYFSGNMVPIKRTVTWYSPDGRVSRAETYSDLRSSPDVVYSSLDNKGNTIYSRDPMGHEVFSSFANTTTRNVFSRPGFLNQTNNGKVFFDDFNDWVDDGWTKSSYGAASIGNWLSNNDLDPSYKITSMTGPFSASVELDPHGSGLAGLAVDCIVMVKSLDCDVRLVLSDPSGDVTGIRFSYYSVPSIHGYYIQYLDNVGAWKVTNPTPYAPNVAYHISLDVFRAPVVLQSQLSVDGAVKEVWTKSYSGLMTKFRAQVENAGSTKCVILDDVKMFKSRSVSIDGLATGQFVELIDADGQLIDRRKPQAGSAKFDLTPSVYSHVPYMNFIVRNSTGVSETIGPCGEVWGGDTYRYSKPEYLKGAIRRTSSGFGSETGVIMDDSIPAGTVPSSNFVNVSDPNLSLYGNKYHHDAFSSADGHHNYTGGPALTSPSVNSTDYFVQSVYLPANTYPIEIGIRYCSLYRVTYSWSSIAFWGVNATGGVNMGGLPSPGQWTVLVVKASDIGWLPPPNEPFAKIVRGVEFLHYGGDVYWDKSSYSTNSDIGKVKLAGLTSNMKAELRRVDGSLIANGTVGTGQTQATIDLYSAGARCYPIAASFSVYDALSKLVYESPIFKDVYGGDTYSCSISSTPFYSNPKPPPTFSKLPVGTMQYLDSTKTMESYMKYNSSKPWLLNETKSMNGSSPLVTKYGYDTYGNVIKVTDPTGASLDYVYVNDGTYLNYTKMKVGLQTISQNFSYYPNGLLWKEVDPLKRTTVYEYDKVGRTTKITYPRIDGSLVSVKYVYNDAERSERYYDANGTLQITYYDNYGRVSSVERWNKSGQCYSWREYTYEWNGQVQMVGASNNKQIWFEYDYLGRTTKVWNHGGSFVSTVYDDRNNSVITYDEMNRRKDLVYDANDRLIQSIQYLGSGKVYANMTYDSMGNLLTSSDPAGRVTRFEYDNMARVTKATYPGNIVERYSYDSASRLKTLTKVDAGGGAVIVYKYDAAGRLLEEWVDSNSWKSYTYDQNGNVLQAKLKRDSTTTVTVDRTYDAWDRVKYENTTIGATPYSLKYTYDNRSNVKSLYVAGTWTLNYAYDEFNRLTRISLASPAIAYAQFWYNAQDQFTKIKYGNNAETTYTLNSNRGWLDRITTVVNGQTKLDLSYAHDASGRLTSVGASRVHVYDSLGRVAYSNDTSGNSYGRMSFQFDSSGNRLKQTWNNIVTNYTYDAYGRIKVLKNNTATINYYYDSVGRLLYKNNGQYNWSCTYDAFDQLVTVKRSGTVIEEYTYDAFGRMVYSKQNAVQETTIYSGSTPVYVKNVNGQTTTNTLHVYGNGLHLAKREKVGNKNTDYYYHCDHLGSVRLVSSGTKVVFNTDYLPYGQAYQSSGTYVEAFRFADMRSTVSSGLVQMGARFYDPLVGRFISPDPVLGSPGMPTSLNRYVYCLNDPINRADVTGEWSFFKKLTNFVSSVANAAVNLVGTYVQAVVDTIVAVVQTAVAITQKAIDVAEKVIEDVKQAADAVCDAVVSGVAAVQNAWDNLDPGLKQWIINGAAFAISFIPIAGPLISCIIDGTFVDMWNAIQRGDWAMLALSCAAFVPGAGKLAKVGVKGFVKEASGVAKIIEKRGIKSYGALTKEMRGSGMQSHKLLEKRIAVAKYNAKVNDIESIPLHPKVHEAVTDALAHKIPRGQDYAGLPNGEIREAYASIYGEGSDIMNAIEHYFK